MTSDWQMPKTCESTGQKHNAGKFEYLRSARKKPVTQILCRIPGRHIHRLAFFFLPSDNVYPTEAPTMAPNTVEKIGDDAIAQAPLLQPT
jgi:hypothetical protein